MPKPRMKCAALALILVLFSSWCCLSKPQAVKTREPWITTRSEEGFSIQHPRGWKVVSQEDVILAEGKEGEVFIQPFRVPEGVSPEQAIKAITQNLAQRHPEFAVKGYKKYKEQPLQYLLLAQYKKKNTRFAGLFIVTFGGGSGTFSGFAAPEKNYKKVKETLAKILASFKLDGGTQPQAAPAVAYQLVADPTEGAFSVELPRGWQISAAIWRPYQDPWVKIDAIGQGATIFAKIPHAPIFFVPSYYATGIYGLREGTPVKPRGASIPGVVYRYLSARDYVSAFLLPQLRGSRIISLRDRPDLVHSLKDPQAADASAVEADLLVPQPQGADPFKGKYLICTSLVTTGGTGVWMVTLLGYHAFPPKEMIASQALSRLVQTLRMDSRWLARQGREQAARLQMVLSSSRKISGMIAESHSRSSGSGDPSGSSRRLIQVLGGRTEVENPLTGETQVIDISPGTVWGDAQGNILRTEDPRQRPGKGYEILY